MFYQRVLQLRVLIPICLMLTAAADVAMRFLPTEFFAYRAWEAVTRYRSGDAPMAANVRYHNDREYGDLARMANLPPAREFRRVTFTTDGHGYRNSAPMPGSAPSILVIGTSMSAGGGLSDDQTLSSRLSARLGVGVYNAAPSSPDPNSIRRIAARVGMKKGIVLLEHLERHPIPALADKGDLVGETDSITRAIESSGFEPQVRLVYNWYKVKPVTIVAQSALRQLQNDWWLPNAYSNAVLVKQLPDGKAMLFLNSVISDVRRPRDLNNVNYWLWLSNELAKDNLTLVIFLLPESSTIYLPLLDGVSQELSQASYQDTLEATLKEKGLHVVNLLPTFRREARSGFERQTLLYWRDDTHWNSRGVEVAVDVICQDLPTD